jgi:peroxiredoxin
MQQISAAETPKVGDPAPDFNLPATPEGEKLSLSGLRGHKVLLAFFPFAFSPG